MANVLVVGGAGYVGGALTDALIETNHKIRVYDSLVYEETFRKPVEFSLGDVRDWNNLEPHLKWADVVVWLAALVGDGACAINPDLTKEINQNSVKQLASRFDGRIIFMSTCSVYGAQDGLLHEGSPTNPLSLYAETKLAAERYLEGKNALIFRLGTLFGVGDCFSRIRLDLIVNVMTVKAHLHGRIQVFGGEQYRPLLHVKDVAAAIVANIETTHRGIYNLHHENIRILDLGRFFLKFYPDLRIETTEMKFQDSRNYKVCSDLARETLGFSSMHGIEEGIEELGALVREGRIKRLLDPRHSNQRHVKGLIDKSSTPLGFELVPEL